MVYIQMLCVIGVLCLTTTSFVSGQGGGGGGGRRGPRDENNNTRSPLDSNIFPSEAVSPLDVVDYTGFFHNLAFPHWGAIDEEFTRVADFDYSDGVYLPNGEDRPNPRVLSNAFFDDRSGLGSGRNKTAMVTWFGQQIVEEIMDGQRPGCPPEFANVVMPAGDPLYGPEERVMPIRRARFNLQTGRGPALPRNQINEITPWLDGNLMYGPGRAWADAIRAFQGGRMAEDPDSMNPDHKDPPKNAIGLPFVNPAPPVDNFYRSADRFHMIGNPRGFENPALAALGLLWHREHNRQARRLEALHPDWTDERLFHRARQWVIAIHQHIVFNEWFPAFVNKDMPAYEGFRERHPGISHAFQTAAMRFGHTLVPPGMWLRAAGDTCEFNVDGNFPGHADRDTNTLGTLRTCNTYGNSVGVINAIGIEPILRGACSQITEREDNHVTEDLRGFVFGPPEFTRRDLMVLNIQRAREHGVPPFNEVREAFNLPRVNDWAAIGKAPHLTDELRRLYGDIDKVDLWVGGLLEGGLDGPGETFQAILTDQFTRIRDGDRWYFENQRNGLFSDDDIEAIKAHKLSHILIRNGIGTNATIQEDVFFFNGTSDPCPQPYQLNGSLPEHLNECSAPQYFDYYDESENHILYTVLLVLAWFIIITIVAWWQHVDRNRKVAAASQRAKKSSETRSPKRAVSDSSQASATEARALSRTSTFYIPASRREDVADFLQCALETVKGGAKGVTPKVPSISTYDLALILSEPPGSPLIRLLLAGAQEAGSDPRRVTYGQFCGLLDALLTPHVEAKLDFYFRMFDVHNVGTIQYEDFRDMMACLYHKDRTGSSRMLHETLSSRRGGAGTGAGAGAGAGAGGRGGGGVSRVASRVAALQQEPSTPSPGTPSSWITDADEDRLRGIFDQLDKDSNGLVTRQEFKRFLAEGDAAHQRDYVDPILSSIGLGAGIVESVSKKGWQPILQIGPGAVPTKPIAPLPETNAMERFGAYMAQNRKWFAFLVLYIGANILIFAERFYVYAVEREHRGLRQITGYGVPFTRGAASGIMFNIACCLVPMARRVIAILHTTTAGKVLPLGHAPEFHTIAGWTTAFFTLCHTIGHFFNFFHISTQPQFEIMCLFREVYMLSDELQSFIGFWLMGTMTGATGFLLVVVAVPFFIFSIPAVRHANFRLFKRIHGICYSLFLGLSFAHGGAALVQAPGLPHYMIVPGAILVLDYLLRAQHQYRKLEIVRVTPLASGVTHVEVKKPRNFEYRPGQYINLTRSPLGARTSRTFTLTSAPDSDVLSCHILSTGEGTWTGNLYEMACLPSSPLGKLAPTKPTSGAAAPSDADPPMQMAELDDNQAYARIDGPYGASFTHWMNYDVIVFCAGGIGATPFYSILSDLLTSFRVERFKKHRAPRLQRIYFIWTARTHEQLEWFAELLANLEAADEDGVLEAHMFQTGKDKSLNLQQLVKRALGEQLEQRGRKHDARHLHAAMHFSRPNFVDIFRQVQSHHPGTEANPSTVGVFTCGPNRMTDAVSEACVKCHDPRVVLEHSTENFY